MRQVETSGNDMSYFIDYYSAMLSRSVERMKEHLLGHVLTEKRMHALQATGRLNERQLKGARWLLEGTGYSGRLEEEVQDGHGDGTAGSSAAL